MKLNPGRTVTDKKFFNTTCNLILKFTTMRYGADYQLVWFQNRVGPIQGSCGG